MENPPDQVVRKAIRYLERCSPTQETANMIAKFCELLREGSKAAGSEADLKAAWEVLKGLRSNLIEQAGKSEKRSRECILNLKGALDRAVIERELSIETGKQSPSLYGPLSYVLGQRDLSLVEQVKESKPSNSVDEKLKRKIVTEAAVRGRQESKTLEFEEEDLTAQKVGPGVFLLKAPVVPESDFSDESPLFEDQDQDPG